MRSEELKKGLLAAILVLMSLQVNAQKVDWDSTYRPDIYPSRVEAFKAAKHRKSDIVLLGNSITFWVDWQELTSLKKIKNRGVPGDITFGVLERLPEIIEGKPSRVFLLIGINDLARNIPEDVILTNYSRIISAIKNGSPTTKIYIQSIMPTNDSFGKLPNHCNKDEQIVRLNTQISALCQTEKVGYIDLHSRFKDQHGKLKKDYTWDGVHLTLAGYQQWVNVLKEGKYLR